MEEGGGPHGGCQIQLGAVGDKTHSVMDVGWMFSDSDPRKCFLKTPLMCHKDTIVISRVTVSSHTVRDSLWKRCIGVEQHQEKVGVQSFS